MTERAVGIDRFVLLWSGSSYQFTVATEAAGMADHVGVGAPGHIHLGESGECGDILKLDDGRLDLGLFILVELRVIPAIEIGDGIHLGHGFSQGGIDWIERVHRFSLDEG